MAPADDLPYIAPPAKLRRSERGNRGVPATRFDEEIYVSSLSLLGGHSPTFCWLLPRPAPLMLQPPIVTLSVVLMARRGVRPVLRSWRVLLTTTSTASWIAPSTRRSLECARCCG